MTETPNHAIWAGALTLLLVHQETGCPHSARQAARLLECIAESDGLDDAVSALVERASLRLDPPPAPARRPLAGP
jgi:hypothetical protein